MANKKLPNYRLKQKILYVDKTNADILQNYGDLFLQEGNLSDALDFYQKARHNEGIQKIRDIGLKTGDTMIFQHAAKALNIELTPADWTSVGQRALELKKYFFAGQAFEKADNQELLTSLKKIMEAQEKESST